MTTPTAIQLRPMSRPQNDHPDRRRAEAADHGQKRDALAAVRNIERRAPRALGVGHLEAQRHHTHVRGRERDHGAERIEVGQQGDLARRDKQRGDRPEQGDGDIRRESPRMHAAQRRRQLLVPGHGVRQPRGADDARIGADDQDGRGKNRDPRRQDHLQPREASR
jgi:hypothetical protein